MHYSHRHVPVVGALLGGAVAVALAVSMIVAAQAEPTPTDTAPTDATPTITTPVPCSELTTDQLPYTSGVTLEGYVYCPSAHIDMRKFNTDSEREGVGGSWAHWLPETHTLQVQRWDAPGCYNVPLSLTYTDQGSYTLTWQSSMDLEAPPGEGTFFCALVAYPFSYDIVLPADAPTPINFFEKAPLLFPKGPSLVPIVP